MQGASPSVGEVSQLRPFRVMNRDQEIAPTMAPNVRKYNLTTDGN